MTVATTTDRPEVSALPSSSLPPPHDPREVLRNNRDREGAVGAAGERMERLLRIQGGWLRGRVQRAARHFRLDADDLCQELMLSMLRRSTTVDESNRGVRSWLGWRVDRTAQDMLRRRGSEIAADPEQLAAIERDLAASGRMDPVDPLSEITLDLRQLVAMGLTPNEAQTVALRCTGIDMPLKDFAELVCRSHASVRKELERGLRKMENLFGLTDEEAAVIRAWHRHGTAQAAAPHVNRSDDDVIRILDDAHKKIDRVFDEKEARP